MLEFGIYQGRTVDFIAERLPPGQVVFGFDLFAGLPENWRPGFGKGTFAAAIPEVCPNVRLVAGLFENTLPPFLAAHAGRPVAFIHVDCGLYTSARTVLRRSSPPARTARPAAMRRRGGGHWMGMEEAPIAISEDYWRVLAEAPLAGSAWARLLVLGAADRGKSTLCRFLVHRLAADGIAAARGRSRQAGRGERGNAEGRRRLRRGCADAAERWTCPW